MKSMLMIMLSLLFVFNAYAGDPLANFNVEVVQLEKEAAAIKNEQESLDKEKADLTTLINTWKSAVEENKRQNRLLDQEVSSYLAEKGRRDTEVANHNATSNVPRNPSDLANYNANANRLNEWKERLNAWHGRMKQKESDLNWSLDQLRKAQVKNNEMVLAWTAKQKTLNARRDEFKSKVDNIQKRMADQCLLLLKDPTTTDEALKYGCDQFFDGSRPGLPTLEQLGIKPPFKVTPGK